MGDIPAYYLQPLSWHRLPSRAESYELRSISGVIASLVMRGRYDATVTSLAATWYFQSKGLFRRTADIILEATGEVLATARTAYWSASATLPVHATLSLSFDPSTWNQLYLVRTNRGRLVFSYDFRGLVTLRSPLVWGEEPESAADLPWLIPFAWFLAVRQYRQNQDAAAAAAIS